jgi:predicted dehydrogenase
MDQIVIIGAGQLGSRHLEALAKVQSELTISLVDPSQNSLDKALAIFKAAGGKHNVNACFAVGDLPIDKIDVAIVATNSLVRRQVVEQLIGKCTIRYLVLEKFLFTEVADYDAIDRLLDGKGIPTWVNCPRRMFDVYKSLKTEVGETSIIAISGSQWGLGSNGIHMLDLVSYLTGECDLKLNCEMLDKTIKEGKREGYIEFTGKITGSTRSGRHNFTLASYAEPGTSFIITINSNEKNFLISESNKQQIFYNASLGDNNVESSFITIPFQSQLSNKVVERILTEGKCELTPYKESAKIHVQYLETLIKFIEDTTLQKTERCLIT